MPQAPETPQKSPANKYGFRTPSRKVARSKSPTRNSRTPMSQKLTRTPIRKTTSSVSSFPSGRKARSVTSSATKDGLRTPSRLDAYQVRRAEIKARRRREEQAAARRRKYLDGNSAYNPIEIEKNFIIKVEDVDVPIKLENGDDLEHPIILNEQAVLRHPRCIPAKRDPGKPRGFAAMTKEDRAKHDFCEYADALNRKHTSKKTIKVIAARDNRRKCSVESEEEENDESDMEDPILAPTLVRPQKKRTSGLTMPLAEFRSFTSTSTNPPQHDTPAQLTSISQSDVERFEASMSGIVWPEFQKVEYVVAAINGWQHRYSENVARLALEKLAEKGNIRLVDGKVYFPHGLSLLDKRIKDEKMVDVD